MEWNERKARIPRSHLFAILLFGMVMVMVITVLIQS